MFMFQLPNHLFEELAMDVYDEVDRRENNTGNVDCVVGIKMTKI